MSLPSRGGRWATMRPVMFLTAIWPLLAPIAAAQAPATDDAGVQVRVAIDDRDHGRLDAPVLAVQQAGVEPVRFRDDGQIAGDIPGDGIVVASVRVAPAESLAFTIRDGDAALGTFTLALPASGDKAFAFKATDGEPALIMDTKAPAMPAAKAADPTASTLVVTAAPVGDTPETSAEGADRIAVRFIVDDRALGRLQDASVAVDQQGVDPAKLTDDGAADGDTAGDQIYHAYLTVTRAQYLGFHVVDGSEVVGRLSVFLPSSSEALVRVATTTAAAGLELKTEPTATGSTDSPSAGVSSASSGGGDGRLVHVLWVLIGLCAVGFGWLRHVVAREWRDEVRPVLRKLGAWLDRELPAPPDDEETA